MAGTPRDEAAPGKTPRTVSGMAPHSCFVIFSSRILRQLSLPYAMWLHLLLQQPMLRYGDAILTGRQPVMLNWETSSCVNQDSVPFSA